MDLWQAASADLGPTLEPMALPSPFSNRSGEPQRSLLLSIRNAYEALRVSAPTVVDAAVGRLTRETCDDRLASFARNVVANARIDLVVHGRENLADIDRRAYVVMSNHQSHYDVPVLFCVLGGRVRMVAKKELFALPVFGQALRDSGMIEVDRKNRRSAMANLSKARDRLEGGRHIWIAPEGTRSPNGELLPFKKGGFVLAFEMQAPILPITISGTRDVLPASDMRSRPGRTVHVTVHPPIETRRFVDRPSREARVALVDEVRNAIASSL